MGWIEGEKNKRLYRGLTTLATVIFAPSCLVFSLPGYLYASRTSNAEFSYWHPSTLLFLPRVVNASLI